MRSIHVKYSWFSDFNETWILLTDFRKILKHYIVWKSVQREQSWPMPTDRRQTDRQTSMKKLIVFFWKFPNAPKNARIFYLITPYNCTENWRWYLAISITELVGFICLSVFWKNTPYRKRSLFQPEVKTGKEPSQVLSSEWENLNYWISLARFEDNNNNKTFHKEIRWRL